MADRPMNGKEATVNVESAPLLGRRCHNCHHGKPNKDQLRTRFCEQQKRLVAVPAQMGPGQMGIQIQAMPMLNDMNDTCDQHESTEEFEARRFLERQGMKAIVDLASLVAELRDEVTALNDKVNGTQRILSDSVGMASGAPALNLARLHASADPGGATSEGESR